MPGLRLQGPNPSHVSRASSLRLRSLLSGPLFAETEVEDGNVAESLQKAAKKLQKEATLLGPGWSLS